MKIGNHEKSGVFSLLTCSILEKQEALTIHKKKCQSLNNYNFILNLMTLNFKSTTSPSFIIGVPFRTLSLSTYSYPTLHSPRPDRIPAHDRLRVYCRDIPVMLFFRESLASTSKWLVGSSRSRIFVSLLMSLQRRTFACSPPLNTLT